MAKSKRRQKQPSQNESHLKNHIAVPVPNPGPASFPQKQKLGGLLVTAELDKALQECKERVEKTAADCRRKNRKFRDIEFDIELDKNRCLHGMNSEQPYKPSDIQRVTQIFDNPSFFIDGADSNDIIQGELGDCWFLSALATMATSKGLVEKFCVARDEKVGVYGFIFFRDTTWVTVIIDDMLYTAIPKFEELNAAEQQLYHNDKEVYNRSARKNGKSLYFSKSGTHDETWVPLIEKAYAKLHGSYAALQGGEAGEAIEDLTGCEKIPPSIPTLTILDILDPDVFWTDELLLANTDRLFGCAFNNLDGTRSGIQSAPVNGLIGAHSYSILRAKEYKGKRFLVIRNPWGQFEWTGPWSDGSKEWTPEWLPALKVLGHLFGNDGEFIMEYTDFLENWEQIDRTLLFDASYIMSSQWLTVTTRQWPSVWTYGDVSFTISLPEASHATIVLSKLDERYWQAMAGRAMWSFDFLLYRKGESEPLTASSSSIPYSRSVNAELFLEAGEYVVHVGVQFIYYQITNSHLPGLQVRLDRFVYRSEIYKSTIDCESRAAMHALTEKIKSRSIISNGFEAEDMAHFPVPLDTLAGRDLSELEAEAQALASKDLLTEQTSGASAPSSTPSKNEANASASLEGITAEVPGRIDNKKDATTKREVASTDAEKGDTTDEAKGRAETVDEENDKHEETDDALDDEETDRAETVDDDEDDQHEETDKAFDDETDIVNLGLRVYTHKTAPAKVGGQLRHRSLAISSFGSRQSGKSA
ncbi:hypothetical protein H0H87_007581 [Tephrocybe sp. NHM501043]|nr:hypothetical protein H0H87_007581 [Tephrocybe sp. NHM501043]